MNNFILNALLTINLNSVFRNPIISFETTKRLRNFETKNQSINSHPSSPANDHSNKIVGFAGTTMQSTDFLDVCTQTVTGTNACVHQISYCVFFSKRQNSDVL